MQAPNSPLYRRFNMSSPTHAASSLMSPTSSFSVLSSVETRSRSSTLSYQNLDASDGIASLSQSFSELSSNVSGGLAPHVALSQNVSEDESDDDGFLTDEEYDILDASDEDFLVEAQQTGTKK